MPKRYWGNMTEFQETEMPREQLGGSDPANALPVLRA